MRILLNGGGSTEQLIPTMSKINEIIDHNKPKLAISIYHSDDDMIDIIEFIRNKNKKKPESIDLTKKIVVSGEFFT